MLAHYGDFENALESSASGCILGLRNQISSYGTRIAFWMGIPQDCGLLQSMLQAMQQTATPAPASPSFAGLLAALATPAQQRALAWNDDDLADDVATLSYERALRAHARYIPVDPADLSDRSLLQPANPGPLHSNEVHPPDAPSTPSGRDERPKEPNLAMFMEAGGTNYVIGGEQLASHGNNPSQSARIY